MAHDIADREPVAINEREAPDPALGQFDCSMRSAGAQADAKNRLSARIVVSRMPERRVANSGCTSAKTVAIDSSAVLSPQSSSPIERTVRRNKLGGVGTTFLRRTQEDAQTEAIVRWFLPASKQRPATIAGRAAVRVRTG